MIRVLLKWGMSRVFRPELRTLNVKGNVQFIENGRLLLCKMVKTLWRG